MSHVRCTAHILNLIVKGGLSVIGDVLVNISESANFFIGSVKRKETFRCRDLGRIEHVIETQFLTTSPDRIPNVL